MMGRRTGVPIVVAGRGALRFVARHPGTSTDSTRRT